jgi:nucleoid DNA-binding protein
MRQRYTKNKLWLLITKRINHSVHRLHVLSIISILIEEIIAELKSGKEVKISNFGTFRISKLKPKKIISVATKEVAFAKKTKALRFRLTRRLSKYLSIKSLEKMKNSVEICEENQDQ